MKIEVERSKHIYSMEYHNVTVDVGDKKMYFDVEFHSLDRYVVRFNSCSNSEINWNDLTNDERMEIDKAIDEYFED